MNNNMNNVNNNMPMHPQQRQQNYGSYTQNVSMQQNYNNNFQSHPMHSQGRQNRQNAVPLQNQIRGIQIISPASPPTSPPNNNNNSLQNQYVSNMKENKNLMSVRSVLSEITDGTRDSSYTSNTDSDSDTQSTSDTAIGKSFIIACVSGQLYHPYKKYKPKTTCKYKCIY